MTETIRRAMIKAISEKFTLPVYGQVVPQGGERPCFTVELMEMEQKQLLGRRNSIRVTFCIEYYHGTGSQTAAEGRRAAEGLMEVLRLIGNEEKFAAFGMKQEKTEEGIRFQVSYEYHILWDEDEDLMRRLEYNGEKVVGYEEETGIQ